MTNKDGLEALVTNYGLRLVSLQVPDKNGIFNDVVLGYDTLQEYQTKNPFQNSIIGRYANRIANGRFTIDGTIFEVDKNHDGHCLHGGQQGLHEQVWDVKEATDQRLHFYHFSKAGTMGFPGNLNIDVYVVLNNSNELQIQFKATTDATTPINLTYHPYFNLSGASTILNHELMIPANHILATDQTLIPTGKFISVEDTPFDFRKKRKIFRGINSEFEAIKKCGGYDHNFVLKKDKDTDPILRTILSDPENGSVLEVWSPRVGLQVYTCNGVHDIGKNGKQYGNHCAICLEPQYFPDSPNHENFPTTILRPGEEYSDWISYRFC